MSPFPLKPVVIGNQVFMIAQNKVEHKLEAYCAFLQNKYPKGVIHI